MNHHPTHWIDGCVFVLSLGKRWLLWSVRMGWRWRSFFLRDVHAHTASPSLTHNALQVWAQIILLMRVWYHQSRSESHDCRPQVRTTAPLRTAAVRTCVSRGPADSPAAVPTPETDRVWSRTRTSERRRDWFTARLTVSVCFDAEPYQGFIFLKILQKSWTVFCCTFIVSGDTLQ